MNIHIYKLLYLLNRLPFVKGSDYNGMNWMSPYDFPEKYVTIYR